MSPDHRIFCNTSSRNDCGLFTTVNPDEAYLSGRNWRSYFDPGLLLLELLPYWQNQGSGAKLESWGHSHGQFLLEHVVVVYAGCFFKLAAEHFTRILLSIRTRYDKKLRYIRTNKKEKQIHIPWNTIANNQFSELEIEKSQLTRR